MTDFIKAVEAKQNDKIRALQSGDTVNVHVRIKEGDRERIQGFGERSSDCARAAMTAP